jgi:AAA+ ATPase superfamily predicted ATPase
LRFVNREAELAALRRWWEAPTGRSAVVWGRRRVGKTALLQQFSEGRRAVFHTGAGRPAPAELALLTRQAASAGPARLRDLTARPYVDWDDALDDLAQAAEDEPTLVVLDEFPDLVATSPELPGVLRAFLDRAQGRTKMRLLLCGSAVRYMEELQEHRAPLYGRFDLTLAVHPFAPHEAAAMLPDLSPSDRALVYGLVGGVPLYLTWWDQGASVRANLHRLACRPGAPLLTEGQLVLATEAERGEHPAAALYAVAAGRTRYGQIKDALRAEPARTLDRLQELRLIDKLVPVTETARSRRAIYRIADNFLAFYLAVLSRFRAEIERGLGDSILTVITQTLDDHLGPRWEDTLRQHVRRLAAAGELGDGIVGVGGWWSDDSAAEIDVVAVAGRGRTPVLAGEAKWARRQHGDRLARQVLAKAQRLPGVPDVNQLKLLVCAREELENVPSDVLGITAHEIFGLP